MTPQERIAALEGMLERIRRNAAKPRTRAAAAPAVKPADSAFDRTVDELLEAPIPVVQTSAQQRSPSIEPLSIEPLAARSHEPPPPAQVPVEAEEAAIPQVEPKGPDMPALSGVQPAARAQMASAEELSEDDLISVAPEPRKSEPPPEIQIPVHDELDFDDDEEEVPASSQRARVAASIEEALTAAPDEHEVPIKTPPPESGPQEAAPPSAALEPPRVPDIREAFDRGPTPEQLGETIELPEPSDAKLELDVHTPEPPAAKEEPVSEELEVALPTRAALEANLSPPAPAREQAAAEGEAIEAIEATQVVRRREIAGAAVARVLSKAAEFKPQSFLELLDASLRLGSE